MCASNCFEAKPECLRDVDERKLRWLVGELILTQVVEAH